MLPPALGTGSLQLFSRDAPATLRGPRPWTLSGLGHQANGHISYESSWMSYYFRLKWYIRSKSSYIVMSVPVGDLVYPASVTLWQIPVGGPRRASEQTLCSNRCQAGRVCKKKTLIVHFSHVTGKQVREFQLLVMDVGKQKQGHSRKRNHSETREHKLSVRKRRTSRDLTRGIVIAGNNTALCTWKLLTAWILKVLATKRNGNYMTGWRR